jgi:FSR family fosmidomycin resistance protein-like MFS transporter
VVAILLAIELLDELVGGVRAAAWPLIREDLGLSYAEIGLVLAIPGFVGSALEPAVGVLGDTRRRRAIVVVSGAAFAVSVALTAGAVGFWSLLLALVVGNPATSGFVSLSQATLMDVAPDRRERLMAWWTLAGSFGYVGGPVLLTVGLFIGVGWRGVLVALAVAAVGLTVAARLLPVGTGSASGSPMRAFRDAVAAARDRDVLRWLVVLKASDLLLDVFHGFLALYLVDVVGVGAAEAGLGVAVWTGAGLVGDAALIPVLSRIRGVQYLRATALAAIPVYAGFLLMDAFVWKLVLLALLGLLNSGWYAIPKAGLYQALPGRSGTAVAVSGVAGLVHSAVPALLGAAAGAVGLGATMWVLIAAPVALILVAPRR